MKKNIILLSIFLCLLVSCKSLPFAKKQAPTTTDTLTQENLPFTNLFLQVEVQKQKNFLK